MDRRRKARDILLRTLSLLTLAVVGCGTSHVSPDSSMRDAGGRDATDATDGSCCTASDSAVDGSLDSGADDGGTLAFIWEPGPTLWMFDWRVNRNVLVADNGRVVDFAGSPLGASYVVDYWTPGASAWSSDSLDPGVGFHTVSHLPDGRLLSAGSCPSGVVFNIPPRGATGSPASYGYTYAIDAETERVQIEPPMLTSRGFHRAVELLDRRVLACGGWHSDGVPATDGPTTSCERFDLPMGHWIATASMATGRYSHTLTRLADGKVLAAGGHDIDGHAITSAELYDPVADAWHTVGDMGAARAWHEAQVLPSGEVLVMGGETEEARDTGRSRSSAELFDPMTERFRPAPDMPWRAGNFASLALPSGRVVISGGRDRNADHNVPFVAFYDEASGWQMGPAMSVPRSNHSMVRLLDGRLMVIEGYTEPLINDDGTSEISSEALP